MEGIEIAIMHGVEAGKLRTYVQENGGGLAGLMRLADRHSGDATAALVRAMARAAPVRPAAGFMVKDRPGPR